MPLAPPNKLLAGLLSFVGDSIEQLVNGLTVKFVTQSFSPELVVALDMDKYENGDFRFDFHPCIIFTYILLLIVGICYPYFSLHEYIHIVNIVLYDFLRVFLILMEQS